MAMTAAVKDELSRVPVARMSARKAELATILRFAGALHLVGGHIVIEAELDTGSVARRLRKEIADIFGHGSEVQIVGAGGIRKGSRYLVRVVQDGERLARQAGLVDLRGRPVKGLPHHVVAGGIADAEAAWRGAFLAHGSLTEPGRACSLEITCPSAEAALALVGVGRRLGVQSKAREVRGGDRVIVRDGDAIGALLTRIGAHESVLAWRGACHRQPPGELRRRQPAPVGAGGRGGRRPGGAGLGDPRGRRAGAPAAGRPAAT
jgi:DNA-binding protein WhiA